MKPVKTFVSIVVLLLALAAQAPAGEQQTPGAAAQPSPTPNAMTYSGVDTTPILADPYTEQSGDTVETTDYLLFEALTALIYLY
jgi:hypothetical protein